jgi:hypothetical protein
MVNVSIDKRQSGLTQPASCSSASQSGRGEGKPLPSHSTCHAEPQQAVHEAKQTALMAIAIIKGSSLHPI